MCTQNYSKNPYPLRNHIIPNEASVGSRNCKAAGQVVHGALAVAELGNMRFINGYELFFLSRGLHLGSVVLCSGILVLQTGKIVPSRLVVIGYTCLVWRFTSTSADASCLPTAAAMALDICHSGFTLSYFHLFLPMPLHQCNHPHRSS